MKKAVALLLVVLALSVLLVACGESDSDKKAEIVIPTDAEGATVYATDAEGYPVYPTDADGKPVYATDAEGNDIIASDGEGNAIIGNGGATEAPAKDDETKAPDATKAPSPTKAPSGSGSSEQPTEEEIPVIIATIPDQDPYELPIL